MEFRQYQHVERFGTDATDGIQHGVCYVFPKIDGTNASVWLRDGSVCAGSRTRELSAEKDNAGFFASITEDNRIKEYLLKHPSHRLFGEWLVPHTLKTYRANAWRKFYIFDVCVDKGDDLEYIPYDTYKPLLEEFGLDYLAPIAIVHIGDKSNFEKCLEKNVFLIEDGNGVGEGVVIKNYDFYNNHSKQVWAKIVTNEFKESHSKEMGAPVVGNRIVESDIVDCFVTTSFVEKEFAKIVNEYGEWNQAHIARLLDTVFSELIQEEMLNILKQYQYPAICFKTLRAFTIKKVKAVKPNIFTKGA